MTCLLMRGRRKNNTITRLAPNKLNSGPILYKGQGWIWLTHEQNVNCDCTHKDATYQRPPHYLLTLSTLCTVNIMTDRHFKSANSIISDPREKRGHYQ